MSGIVTLLVDGQKDLVESIWHELKVECGLTDIADSPAPHFSWQVADDYDFIQLEPVLLEIAAKSKPFQVKTAGLGVFSGEKPVVYLSLVKDSRLLEFHEMVWHAAYEAGIGINSLYEPQHWMPHITLASNDIDRSNLACVMEHLVFRSHDLEIQVDNLSAISQQSDQIFTQSITYRFGG